MILKLEVVIKVPDNLKQWIASFLLIGIVFAEGQIGRCDDSLESAYRQQVSVEQQSVYDAQILESTKKIEVELSPLYAVRTQTAQRLKAFPHDLEYEDWLWLTGHLKFMDDCIMEVKTKNSIASVLIKNLYQEIAMCHLYAVVPPPPYRVIPPPPEEPYPYAPGMENKPKTPVSKTELDPRTTLPKVVDSQRIAGVGFYERQGEILKEKSGLMGFFQTEEKLSSPFFDTAPKGSIKIRTETILVLGSSSKQPTVESATTINGPDDIIQNLFKREKPPLKIVELLKKAGRFLKSL